MRVYHRTPMPAQVRLQEGESYGRAKQMALTSSQPSSSRGTSDRDTSGRYTDQSADSQSGLCSSYIAARNADASEGGQRRGIASMIDRGRRSILSRGKSSAPGAPSPRGSFFKFSNRGSTGESRGSIGESSSQLRRSVDYEASASSASEPRSLLSGGTGSAESLSSRRRGRAPPGRSSPRLISGGGQSPRPTSPGRMSPGSTKVVPNVPD